MNKFLFFLFAFISFFLHTNAKNIYVNDNSTTNGDIYTTAVGSSTNSGLTPGSPLLTLGSAIGIAVANDVIYVDAGTYPGSTNNTLSIPTTLSGIQIIGAHISKTIFNGGITGIKNFLTILAKDITIKNMTISNYGYGGAVNVIASDAVVNSKVYFENVYFYRNLKSVAFNVSPSSHINGGALSIEVSGANKPAEVHVTNCQFDHNTSEDNLGGGAIYVSEKSNLILDRSRITCNNKGELQTTEDGGGILFDDSEGTITNSFFSGNIAQDRSGGAIQTINATTTKTLTISESIFTKNEAKNGAAISIEDRYLVNITNSLFYDNLQRTSSFQDGGTIDIHAGGTATINLVNSTVAYNRSTGGGTDAAGLANSTSGVFNVKNSIIWGNASKNINSANIITTYCIIENVGNSSPANATNSFLNPQFTSTVTPDYSLLPASPAINFGTLTGAPLNDIANNSRVGNPDAGCFEALSTNPISNISSCDALFCASTPSISVTASSNVSCNGGANGSATITPSGGSGSYTITWSPGNLTGAIQNSLTAQIYTITVDDGGACIGTKTLSITQPSTFTVGLTANSNTICTTNSLVLTPVGALTYTLNPGNLTGNSFTLSPASTTIYSVTGTSALGCLSSNTASTEVTVNTTPTAAITPPSTLTCSSKTITLTGSGGGGYSWSGPGIVTGSSTATPSVNVAGVYNLTVTSSGCSNSTSVAVIANTITPLVSTTTNTLTCSITTVNISVTTTTTPVDYLWSGSGILSANNTSTINVNQSGNFNYTVTNTTNGCLANGNVIVSQNITPPSASASGGTLTCITTSLSLTGGPLSGVTYSWSGPGINGSSTSSSATAIASGSYTLITTSAINGCSNTAVTTVSSNTTVPQISIGSDLTINCLTATVTLNGSSSSPGVNYSWTGPSMGIPAGATPTSSTSIVSASGIYTLTVVDPLNGCSNSAFESVSTNTILPDIALSSSSQTITCSTPTITLSGSSLTSGVTYSWNPGGSSPSNSVTTINTNGTYSLTVTNTLSGCISTSVVTVTSNTVLPTLTLTPTSYTTTCSNPTTTLIAESDADPDVTYSWTVPSTGSINNPNISNPIASGSGAFTVQATNTLSGCMSSIAIANIIADINVPVLNVTATNSTICSGSTSTLSITGADTYSWSTTETGSSITVSPTVTTTYSVIGTNTLTGCSNVINTTVNVNITPTVSLLSISNQTICSGNTATIIPTGANTYTLISNIDTYTNDPFIVNPTTTTTYTLNGESAEGCLSGNTETVTITVNATPTVAILAVSNSTFCSGNNSVITPTALPIGAVSYTLEPG
ncbi:MAG: hypothetical protein JNM51_16790, partial [Bacteroidia bacterium]|nr:hypothetical protein [Bacteroidia bacterium]